MNIVSDRKLGELYLPGGANNTRTGDTRWNACKRLLTLHRNGPGAITTRCIHTASITRLSGSASAAARRRSSPSTTTHHILIFLSTAAQLLSVAAITPEASYLQVAPELKSVGVTVDSQLAFDNHTREKRHPSRLRALRHVRGLLADRRRRSDGAGGLRCKNVRISTDILWRVFHYFNETDSVFVIVNGRNNEALAHIAICNVLDYTVNFSFDFLTSTSMLDKDSPAMDYPPIICVYRLWC